MKDSTYVSVCNTLATYFNVHPANVKPDQQLRRDWGMDRIELNIIALRLEESEDVEIRTADLDAVNTVGQLVALVRALHRRTELMEDVAELGASRPRRARNVVRRISALSKGHGADR